MATSAFKSTSKRASIGGSSSDDSSHRFLHRSRSLSQFSHPIAPEPETDTDHIRNVPRGKFVNTSRGSTMPFPEISLDDLALEFFSSSSSKNDNESDGVVVERKERKGCLVSRRGEMGRWATDTASSRRRGRSVSRTRGGELVSSNSASGTKYVSSSDAGSRRRRSLSVARTRGDVVSSNSASGANKDIPSDAVSRRRRSLSVARCQTSDSESEVDHSRNLSNHATVKASLNGNYQISSAQKTTASSTRRLGRSRRQKGISPLQDGYSSHSSALTDEEAKDTHFGKKGLEKIIRPVYTQKAEHPTEDVTNGGLYEAMRKELRYAVQEIRTELNQAIGRNQTAGDRPDQDFSRTREKHATKLEQLEQHKQDLLTKMLLEEQRGQEVSKMVKELPYSGTSAVAEKPSRARKKSSDRSRTSEKFIDEEWRYFEDFIYNINNEDADISSFDGERSDGSSTLGGKMKERDATVKEAETRKTHAGYTSHPVEMDGVILPWLQWETSHDGYLSGTNTAQTPVTSKAVQKDSEKDMVSVCDPSSHSISSHGSWSPGLFNSPPVIKREDECKSIHVGVSSCFDMDEYLKLRDNEELLFELYRERNRINSGGMLLCTGGFY